MKYYNITDVKAAAQGGWAGVLSGMGVDAGLLTNKHSPCPGCGGKDRFRFDDKGGEGTWMCSGGGDFESGDGVALLMHVRQCEWKVAVNALGEYLQVDAQEYKGKSGGGAGSAGKGVVYSAPEKVRAKLNEIFDHDALREKVAGVQSMDVNFFLARSPMAADGVTPGEFLDTIFEEGERALVFTNFYSQGDYGWQVGRGGFRLAREQGVKAVKSRLPLDGGKDGVWFLSNPVSLGWESNPRSSNGKMGRRIKECVTSWRYLVLESDQGKEYRKESAEHMEMAQALRASGSEEEAVINEKLARDKLAEAIEFEENWLKWLAIFPDPIRAIYSSAGGSWHALVHTQCGSWAAMDGLLKGAPGTATKAKTMGAKEYWAMFGADAGALTPVRLTRLPGCSRNGKLQRLIYLNPAEHSYPDGKMQRIVDLVPRRDVK